MAAQRSILSGIAVLFLIQGLAGCSDGQMSRRSGPSPIPQPGSLPPSVASLSLNAGSTGGGTPLTIAGTGFLPGALVSFGGSTVKAIGDAPQVTKLFLTTPAHDPGSVDIVVTNPDGQTVRLFNAWTYRSPDEFDLNGTWAGGEEWQLGFVIRNNALVRVFCGDNPGLNIPTPVPVSGGAFSFFDEYGNWIAGRIVSENRAVGTGNMPPCAYKTWGAMKVPPDVQ